MFELLITLGVCSIFGLFMYACEESEKMSEFAENFGEFFGI